MGRESVYITSERTLQRNNLIGSILHDAQTFIQDSCANLRGGLQAPEDTARCTEGQAERLVTDIMNTIQNDVTNVWLYTQDFFTCPFRISRPSATQQLENLPKLDLAAPPENLGSKKVKCKILGCTT